MISCLILLLTSCIVDRQIYDGRYESEAFTSAEQGIGDFGQAVQSWTAGLLPSGGEAH